MVSSLPQYVDFCPRGNNCQGNFILMSVDEYEVIKLIDYFDLTQEETALKMNVARTTVQQIYHDARKKMALMLVKGLPIKIQGGNYKVYGGPHCNKNN